MRSWLVLVCLFVPAAVAGGCSGKRAGQEPAAKTTEPNKAAILPAAPEPAVIPAAEVEPVANRKPMLRLTLRSTPSGALASVDGRQVGQTPLVHELEADGRIHEFTFVRDGYSMERYRFPPVKDGVIHATLRPIEQAPDAGTPAPVN